MAATPRELERRCEAGQARECVSLGILYAEGKSVVADPQRALTLFTQACDRRDLMGCNAQGRMLAQGEPRDVPKAHALYDRACRGRVLTGLRASFTNVSCTSAVVLSVWTGRKRRNWRRAIRFSSS